MATGIYTGIGDTARNNKAIYAGVDGVARKVIKVYAGIDNVARLAWSAAPPYDPILANNTWEQINDASINNRIPSTWLAGDAKPITLSTNETLDVQIAGINHDILTAGGTAGISFLLKNLMATTRRMHSSDNNSGGIVGKELYTWLNNTLFYQLPANLQAVIKPVNKVSGVGSTSNTDSTRTDSMTIFLPSRTELGGSSGSSAVGEGTQYSIFTNNASRTKYLSNGAGAVSYWWTRSPYTYSSPNYNTNFLIVSNTGSCGSISSTATSTHGICFGFCI